MDTPWSPEHITQIIHRAHDTTPPKRRKVSPGQSNAYIRVSTDLMARRGL
jgi:hypothetical protein